MNTTNASGIFASYGSSRARKCGWIVSCDWFAVSCLSDWATDEVKLTRAERESDLPEPDSAETPTALAVLNLPDSRPRQFVGYSLYDNVTRRTFAVEESQEFNPAYRFSACIMLCGKPLAHFFWAPRNQYVDKRSCQAKVANNALYTSDWVSLFRACLRAAGWKVQRVNRVDVCCDFQYFANRRLPLRFAQDYLSKPTATRPSFLRKSSNKFRAAGVKSFANLMWETISWGTRDSAVQVNLYNKTKELDSVHDKPYIRDKWRSAGLPYKLPSQLKKGEKAEFVWRVEFSIDPTAKFKTDVNSGRDSNGFARLVSEISADDVASQEALDKMFEALLPDYFQFYYLHTADIKAGRRVKDLEPVQLFDGLEKATFKLRTFQSAADAQTDKNVESVLHGLSELCKVGGMSATEYDKILTAYSAICDRYVWTKEQAAGVMQPEDLLLSLLQNCQPATTPTLYFTRERKAREIQRVVKMLRASHNERYGRYAAGFADLMRVLDDIDQQLADIGDELPDWWYESDLPEPSPLKHH